MTAIQEIEDLYNINYKLTKEAKILPLIVEKLQKLWLEAISKDLNCKLLLYNKNFTNTFKELNELVELKRSCNVEFTRKQKRVLCLKDYSIKTITEDKVLKYIETTKQFLEKVE
jgi:hypothetical protein